MDTTVQLRNAVARLESLEDIGIYTGDEDCKDCYVFTYGTNVAIFLTEQETMALLKDLITLVGHKIGVAGVK